jgi:CHAD domain-containing protein
MMIPKANKTNAKTNAKKSAEKSDESLAKPDVKAAQPPREKPSVAKDMAVADVAVAKTVKPPAPQNSPAAAPIALRVGDYAHGLIQWHFKWMLDERTAVVDDRAPEALHQMRVHGRRLRATIGLFGSALKIPKQGHLKSLQRFHRTLGTLRNLDVVIAKLQPGDYPQLPESEQQVLDHCVKKLAKQRRRALADVQGAIAAQTFEAAYADWLKHPTYRQFAAQTLTHALPQLLLPDLTAFLAHPGWAIAAADATVAHRAVLHDLRKVCKHQRYQLEAVSPIYGAAIATWIVGLKAIQDCLGTLQDLAVLAEIAPAAIALPHLNALLQQQQQAALGQWDELRQPYGQPQFHYQCYELILQVLTV